MKLSSFYCIILPISIIVFAACGESHAVKTTNSIEDSITDSLTISTLEDRQDKFPNWLKNTSLLENNILLSNYELDNRMNPSFLEADFNGDKLMDIVISIRNNSDGKLGYAIIHQGSRDVFIIGAGNTIKNELSDNMDYIDKWSINTEEVNEPGLNEEGDFDPNGPLILKTPSLSIEKTEVGGGLIYWNGKEYAYFHQTC